MREEILLGLEALAVPLDDATSKLLRRLVTMSILPPCVIVCKVCGQEKPHTRQFHSPHLEPACVDCIQTLPIVPKGSRRCPTCLAVYTHRGSYCRKCASDRRRARYTPEIGRQRNLEANHKMSVEKYEIMLTDQEGLCAACGKPETIKRYGMTNGHRNLPVDHNHATNKIRGLLCTPCNVLLGAIENLANILENDPKQIYQVLDYLQCYQAIPKETLLHFLKKRVDLP